MVRILLFIVLFYFYYLMISSVHFLVLLILVEYIVLFCFCMFRSISLFLVVGLFFLLVAVCVGAYSICVYIAIVRQKVSSYLLGFSFITF